MACRGAWNCDKIVREKADALGIKGFLMKPIVMKKLAVMIREVLDDEPLSSRNSI